MNFSNIASVKLCFGSMQRSYNNTFGSIYLGRVRSCDDPGTVSIVVILYWEIRGGDDATRATELTTTHRSWKKRDKACWSKSCNHAVWIFTEWKNIPSMKDLRGKKGANISTNNNRIERMLLHYIKSHW